MSGQCPSCGTRDATHAPWCLSAPPLVKPAPRSASYEFGRARGMATGRAVPTGSDVEWWAAQSGVDGDDDYACDDFGDGMLDGHDQATSRRLGLPCPEPPSAEMLAAAREVSPR